MLALFREVIARAPRAEVPLSMCGEMAGNPLEAMMLIALGFRTLSMTATAIGPVKTMIRSLDAGAVGGLSRRDRRPAGSFAATPARSLCARPRGGAVSPASNSTAPASDP